MPAPGPLSRPRRLWAAASRRRRLILRSLGAAILILLLAGLILFSRGRYETYAPSATTPLSRAPAWTLPCRLRRPRADRQVLRFCAQATGRVLYVTSNRLNAFWEEVHFLVIAHYHVLTVKETTPITVNLTPAIGSEVTAIGPLERSRVSLPEIEVFALHAKGLWWNDIHQPSP